MWVVGFVSSLAYVFVFFFSRLYAVMGLQVYYVIISVYGFYLWARQNDEMQVEEGKEEIFYNRIKFSMGQVLLLVTSLLFAGISWILKEFTDSPVPLGDGFVTALSIVATWMLARRIIEHWHCWVVANACSAVIYYSQALYPTMFLFICYSVLAVFGYFNWKKKGIRTDESDF